MLLLRPKRSVALSTPTQPTLLPQLELAIDFGAPLDFGPAKPRRDSNAASVRVTTQRSAAPVLPSIPVSAPLAMPTTPTTPRTPVSAHSHTRAATCPSTTHERTPSLSSASSSNYSHTPTTPNTSVTSSPGGTSPKTRHSPTHFVPTHVLDEKHLARALTARRNSPIANVRRDPTLRVSTAHNGRRDSVVTKRGRPTSPTSPISPYALPPSPRGRSLGARTSSAAASLLARTRARSTATSRQPPTLAPVPALPPLPPKSLLRDSKKRYSSTPPASPKKQRDSKRDSTMRRILSSLSPPEPERKEDESFYAPDADAQEPEEEFELLCAPTDGSFAAAPNGAKLRRVEKRTVLLVHLPSAAFSVDACERVREFCEGYGEVSTMQAGRAGRVRVEFRDKGVYERVAAGRAQVEGVGVCRVGLERWRGGS